MLLRSKLQGILWLSSHSAQSRCASGKGAPPPDVDSTDLFVRQHLNRATQKGRVTPQAAEYFLNILEKTPQMREAVVAAKGFVGDQDPEHFTAFQQRLYGDVVAKKAAEVASKTLVGAMKEETDMQDVKEGRATGENYWMEGAGGLGDPEVPPVVKDDILAAMQRDRKPNSPAFSVPGCPVGPAVDDARGNPVARE